LQGSGGIIPPAAGGIFPLLLRFLLHHRHYAYSPAAKPEA